jgi:hypothetical protein
MQKVYHLNKPSQVITRINVDLIKRKRRRRRRKKTHEEVPRNNTKYIFVVLVIQPLSHLEAATAEINAL